MHFKDDERAVMTLDAGGTNFTFSAMQYGEEIIEPVNISATATTLDEILQKMINGFREIKGKLNNEPVAISFAFPGPADYGNGIIGDLQNLPLFRGGVALKDMLEEQFGIPAFINNDGDLFAYGEAISGLLPWVNEMLGEKGSHKKYHNLLGVTFGTGFGGGIVRDGKLFLGDNSAGGEINRMRNAFYPETSIEDSVSIRAIRRVYSDKANISFGQSPEPKEIFDIANGATRGDKDAALASFTEFAVAAADALADAVSLIDGMVVIGGGLASAYPLFLDRLVEEMNKKFTTLDGESLSRMEVEAFNLENPDQLEAFLRDTSKVIDVPYSNKQVRYDPVKKVGVGVSRLGTSGAVSVGAYTFALDQLNRVRP